MYIKYISLIILIKKNRKNNKRKKKNMEIGELKDMLEYIGLDLDNPSPVIKDFKGLNFKASDAFSEEKNSIYMNVPISKIDILITNHSNDEKLSVKYKDAISLNSYLIREEELQEGISNFLIFANILKHFDKKIVEQIGKDQEKYIKSAPFDVTYERSSRWNIYYSALDDRYFMLVCSDENEFSEFIYLLKEKIALEKENRNKKNKKEKYIYAPIYMYANNYSYLSTEMISELENKLWYFTDNWPITYEMYDSKGSFKMAIVGKTKIYNDLLSLYKVEISNKEEAEKYFKYVKALFEIDQGTKGYISFKPYITNSGSLKFKRDNIVIEFEDIANILSVEYEKIFADLLKYSKENYKKEEKIGKLKKEKEEKEENLENIQNEVILFNTTTRSFFGKIRYFFKKNPIEELSNNNSRKEKQEKENKEENSKTQKDLEKVKEKEEENEKIKELKEKYTLKGGFCTIEEYVTIYNEYKNVTKKYSDNIKDINALKLANKNIDKNISNAKEYLKDIISNKHNIITFMKYTNKDNLRRLPDYEREKEELKKEDEKENETGKNIKHLSGTFDLDIDFLSFGMNIDKKQRELLSKDEIASVFLTTEGMLKEINIIKEKEEQTDLAKDLLLNSLKDLDNEFEKKLDDNETFDIFGETNTENVRYMKDRAFRETDRDKFKVLKYIKELSYDDYILKLKEEEKNISNAIGKITTDTCMKVYKIAPWSGDLKQKQYDIYNLDLENEVFNLKGEDKNYKLFVLNLNEKTNALFYTNIFFYNNTNNTLPLGMDISSQLLLDMKRLDMIPAKKEKVRIVRKIDGEFLVLNVDIYEYVMN